LYYAKVVRLGLQFPKSTVQFLWGSKIG